DLTPPVLTPLGRIIAVAAASGTGIAVATPASATSIGLRPGLSNIPLGLQAALNVGFFLDPRKRIDRFQLTGRCGDDGPVDQFQLVTRLLRRYLQIGVQFHVDL